MEYGTLAEKRALGRWAWLCILLAVVTWTLVVLVFPQAFGPVMFVREPDGGRATGFALVQLTLWTLGCGLLARSKGYPWLLALSGTLCCVGLLILAVLPDRWGAALRQAREVAPPSELSNYPR